MDITTILPNFPLQTYTNLIPSLEKNYITTTDLITLDVVELAKKARLPLLPLKKLCDNVLQALRESYDLNNEDEQSQGVKHESSLGTNASTLLDKWQKISTLDESIDVALGGGIPVSYITEITGESGVGKTQFLLTLLLSCQLSPPHGLGRAALYISTESSLPTTRLRQMLQDNAQLKLYDIQPTLDKVISIVTPDLETQEHILRYQVPVAIERYNVGLIVLDSVAANYRAEFDRPGASRHGASMAKRSAELTKLGSLLRSYAQNHNLAVVVSNQVSDRFSQTPVQALQYAASSQVSTNSPKHQASQASPLAYRSTTVPRQSIHLPSSAPTSTPQNIAITPAPLKIDHQQRWFTGWGDDADRFSISDPNFQMMPQKTPALGLVWTSQIAARIALIKTPIYGSGKEAEGIEAGDVTIKKWRRYLKVVFASWTKPTGSGIDGAVEFEISSGGVNSLALKRGGETEETEVKARN